MVVLQQEQLFEQIDILPIDFKTALVDKILKSLNPIDDSIENLWIKEVNNRKQDIENNQVNLINGDLVFQKIVQKYKK
jgi:hypothetical protein